MVDNNVQGARSKNILTSKKRPTVLAGEAHPREVVAPKMVLCFYAPDCKGVGTHQCPRCKEMYCEQCHDMFLPVDDTNFVGSNLMCVQCHYTVYGVPNFGG